MEKEANDFAQNQLISQEVVKELFKEDTPLTDEKIKKLASKHKIHPAILLGRICHEKDNYAVKSSIDKTLK